MLTPVYHPFEDPTEPTVGIQLALAEQRYSM